MFERIWLCRFFDNLLGSVPLDSDEGDADCCAQVFRNRTRWQQSVEKSDDSRFRCRAVAMVRMAGTAIDLGS